jgi:hypothetical protein
MRKAADQQLREWRKDQEEYEKRELELVEEKRRQRRRKKGEDDEERKLKDAVTDEEIEEGLREDQECRQMEADQLANERRRKEQVQEEKRERTLLVGYKTSGHVWHWTPMIKETMSRGHTFLEAQHRIKARIRAQQRELIPDLDMEGACLHVKKADYETRIALKPDLRISSSDDEETEMRKRKEEEARNAAKAERKATKKAAEEKAQRHLVERQRLLLQRRNVKVGYFSRTWNRMSWRNISIDGMANDEDIREMAEGPSKKKRLKLLEEKSDREAGSCVFGDA